MASLVSCELTLPNLSRRIQGILISVPEREVILALKKDCLRGLRLSFHWMLRTPMKRIRNSALTSRADEFRSMDRVEVLFDLPGRSAANYYPVHSG